MVGATALAAGISAAWLFLVCAGPPGTPRQEPHASFSYLDWPPPHFAADQQLQVGPSPSLENVAWDPKYLKISPDGRFLAWLCPGETSRIRVWDVEGDPHLTRPVFTTEASVWVIFSQYDGGFGWAADNLVYCGIVGTGRLSQIETADPNPLYSQTSTWVRTFPGMQEQILTDAGWTQMIADQDGRLAACLWPMRPGKGMADVEVFGIQERDLVAAFRMRSDQYPSFVPEHPLFWDQTGKSFFAFGLVSEVNSDRGRGVLVSVALDGKITELTGPREPSEFALQRLLLNQRHVAWAAPLVGGRSCVALLSPRESFTALRVGYFSADRKLAEEVLPRDKLPEKPLVLAFTEDGQSAIVQGEGSRIWCVDIETCRRALLVEGVFVSTVYGPAGPAQWLVAVTNGPDTSGRRRLALLQVSDVSRE